MKNHLNVVDLDQEFRGHPHDVLIAGDDKTYYGKITKDKLLNGNYILFKSDQAWKDYLEIYIDRNYNLSKIEEISSDRYENLFEVMPPLRYRVFDGYECFMMLEGITHDVKGFVINQKSMGKYYYVELDYTNYSYKDVIKHIESL